MKTWMAFLVLAAVALAGCSENTVEPLSGTLFGDQSLRSDASNVNSGRVVIANRASGSISVISAKENAVVGTYDLPSEAGESTPEPMYVVHSKNRVFVGDRANNRVAVFNAHSFEVEGTAPAGNGVFHMWADPQGKQLWVNNDIDNTSTVIDPVSLDVLATVPTPADLVAMGGKPHDVIVGPKGYFAYISVLGVSGDNDYIVQYETATFNEVNRAAVGKDPHLSLSRQHDRLYVPCQNSDVVIVFNRYNLNQMTTIDIPGAHGVGMSRNGKYLYATNLPGGGADAIYTIDTRDNVLVGDPVASPYPVPHNVALNPSGDKIFVTHSGGTADKVTIYQTSGSNPVPEYVAEVTVGLNPFGLAYIN